ncbi:MAG TPA: biotin--[acetyl-CoA-carboxylase] ligase [Puia sp.]|nr:biotin--[acetyl-CoA-carboxylase] ligase [Puia sp.]
MKSHPPPNQFIGNVFVELQAVDSTNNYAMAKVRAGDAFHGNVFYAVQQFAGRGQFGKKWVAEPGQNLTMSIVLEPVFLKAAGQAALNLCIAGACIHFLDEFMPGDFRVKWPNDLYWKDHKVGGLLIENLVAGEYLRFSVVGIGININQAGFPDFLPNPVSLHQITGETFDTVELAKSLCARIQDAYELLKSGGAPQLLMTFNQMLFKKDECVRLLQNGQIIETTIVGVTAEGKLHTRDAEDRYFLSGEVEWLL